MLLTVPAVGAELHGGLQALNGRSSAGARNGKTITRRLRIGGSVVGRVFGRGQGLGRERGRGGESFDFGPSREVRKRGGYSVSLSGVVSKSVVY